jgi:hypothetical protein
MKRFFIAFTLSIIGFAVANFVSLAVRSDGIDDADYSERCGFPILFFAESHYNDPAPYFSHVALAADIGVAVIAGLLVARYYPSIRDDVLRTLGFRPNKPAAPNAGIASRLTIPYHLPGVGEPERSASRRRERY